MLYSLYWKIIGALNNIGRILFPKKKPSKKTVYIDAQGGLCNRMRAIASAQKLAMAHDARLAILWRISGGWLNCSFYDLFCENPGIPVIESNKKASISYIRLAAGSGGVFADLKMEGVKGAEDALEQRGSIYIASAHDFYEAEDYGIFRPTSRIEEKASEICGSFAPDMTGIHIRRTDATEAIRRSPTRLFSEYIETRIMGDASAKFFLATDDRDVEREFLDRFGESVLVNDGKAFGRDSRNGMEDAYVDLLCLSRCSRIVGSYFSSFSQTAARIGGIPLTILTSD